MHEPTSLTDLLKSDLERHYYHCGIRHHKTRRFDLWKLFVHPRCAPIAWYRLAHTMRDHRFGRVVGKVLTWWVFHWYGIEIDARCVIGPGCYIPHPSGTVIGARSIGSRVLIYHQVTLGARAIRMDLGGRPVIGDDVILGAGAKVLGEVNVGSRSTIAPNSLVLNSVPSDVTVMGVPAQVFRRKETPPREDNDRPPA